VLEVRISGVALTDPVAQTLIRELDAELMDLYPEDVAELVQPELLVTGGQPVSSGSSHELCSQVNTALSTSRAPPST